MVWGELQQGARTSMVPAMPGAAAWVGSMALKAACCRCACAHSRPLASCWTHVKTGRCTCHACLSKIPWCFVCGCLYCCQQVLGGGCFCRVFMASPQDLRILIQLHIMHHTCCREVRHHLHDSSGLRDLLRLCLARLLRQHLLRLQRIIHHILFEGQKAVQSQEMHMRSTKRCIERRVCTFAFLDGVHLGG